MVPATWPDLTPWLFPMAESSTSSTLPTDMTATLPMWPTREPPSTLRSPPTSPPLPTLQLQPQLTMPRVFQLDKEALFRIFLNHTTAHRHLNIHTLNNLG